MNTTPEIELYAHISRSADGFDLSIGRDVPGQASHGAATWVGTFSTPADAIRYAQGRGVYSSRITVFIAEMTNQTPMKRYYLIVSHPGMTPYAETTTMRDARRLSREARQLGLSGEIVARFRVVSRLH